MTKPTIHSNGTAAEALVENYQDVMHCLRDLQKAMAKASPHGRDYYPQGDAALTSAINEHRARQTKIIDLQAEYEELALHCVPHMYK